MDEPMMTSKEYAYREKILDMYRQQAELFYDALAVMERSSGYNFDVMRSYSKAHENAMTVLASCLNERDRMALPTIRKEAMDGHEARVANEENLY